MYNIAKVAKGEILKYFNFIFDALCKVRALPFTRSLTHLVPPLLSLITHTHTLSLSLSD